MHAETLLALTLLAAPASDTAHVLDFDAVLEAIRDRSPALLAARAELAAVDGQVDKAWVGWRPKVDAIGRLTLSSVSAELDSAAFFPPELIMLLPPEQQMSILSQEPTVLQPAVQLQGILTLSQTLFNITVLRAPEAAKAARAAATSQVGALEDDLLFSGATLYATLAGLERLEAAAQRAQEVAALRISDAKRRVEAGAATPLEVTRAETDRAQAEGQRISVQAQRRRLLAELKVLVGADGALEVAGGSIRERIAAAPGDVRARRKVQAAEQQVVAAERQVGLHDMKWLPSLLAEGTLLYQNFDGFAGTPFLAQAMFTLALPLYDGGERYADTDIAEAQLTAAQRRLDLELRTARAFLETSAADLVAAQAELAQAEAQLELAQASVTQAERLAEAGLATALDLSDADGRRFQADQLVQQKRLQVELAELRRFYAAGGRL